MEGLTGVRGQHQDQGSVIFNNKYMNSEQDKNNLNLDLNTSVGQDSVTGAVPIDVDSQPQSNNPPDIDIKDILVPSDDEFRTMSPDEYSDLTHRVWNSIGYIDDKTEKYNDIKEKYLQFNTTVSGASPLVSNPQVPTIQSGRILPNNPVPIANVMVPPDPDIPPAINSSDKNKKLRERLKLFSTHLDSSLDKSHGRFTEADAEQLKSLEEQEDKSVEDEETIRLLKALQKENTFKGKIERSFSEGAFDREVREQWDKAKNDFITEPLTEEAKKFLKGDSPHHLMERDGFIREEFGREIDIKSEEKSENREIFETNPGFKDFNGMIEFLIDPDYHNLEIVKADPIDEDDRKNLEILASARGSRFYNDLHEHTYQALNNYRLLSEYVQSEDNVPILYGPDDTDKISYANYLTELQKRLALHLPENEQQTRDDIKKRTAGPGPRFLWFITARKVRKSRNDELTNQKRFTQRDAHLMAILDVVQKEERLQNRNITIANPYNGILTSDQRKVYGALGQLRDLNSSQGQKTVKSLREDEGGIISEYKKDPTKLTEAIDNMSNELVKREGWWQGAAALLTILHVFSLARELGEDIPVSPKEIQLKQELEIRKRENTGGIGKRIKAWLRQRRNEKRKNNITPEQPHSITSSQNADQQPVLPGDPQSSVPPEQVLSQRLDQARQVEQNRVDLTELQERAATLRADAEAKKLKAKKARERLNKQLNNRQP